MSKQLRFNVEEAARYFSSVERTDNEDYLLNIILQLGREHNKLIDNYNKLVFENEALSRKLHAIRRTKSN